MENEDTCSVTLVTVMVAMLESSVPGLILHQSIAVLSDSQV